MPRPLLVAADLFRRKGVTMKSLIPASLARRSTAGANFHFTLLALVALLGVGSFPRGAAAEPSRASLTGLVLDAATRAPLADARVAWSGAAATRETATDAAGRFRFDPAPDGAGTLQVSRLGYRLATRDVAAEESEIEIALDAQALAGPLVEVTTTRPEARGSAVAFTRLGPEQMKEKYWGQDVPMLLAETPGVYAYSDAGNGIGYSYVKVRGFSQRRVAVTINGIPLNDPQSHEVYWVDHPDLLANAATLQVQ
ncbi:MAG TPA: carboxypeptidase regulatory-like domain-containing protein, partial [Candidatus Eisenbacteria bacterium]